MGTRADDEENSQQRTRVKATYPLYQDVKRQHKATKTFPAEVDPECTVEEFLTGQRDRLVREMESVTGSLLQELSEDCSRATSALRDEFAAPEADGYELRLTATAGPHAGTVFELKVRKDEPCYLGRSSGKKFKANGVSLPKDGEVSTSHAKILLQSGKVVVVDLGSTNGTVLDGTELHEFVPATLVALDHPRPRRGLTTLVLGGTSLQLTAFAPLARLADKTNHA